MASLIGMFHHEIFLEEAQQLTIGRDSNSIADVFKNMLYEGHVTLRWGIRCFFLSHALHLHRAQIYMQLFHLLVINTTVFIFLRYAPFDLPVKTLVIFGCYFLFVYSLISRNYALGILLLFICCILLANPAKKMGGHRHRTRSDVLYTSVLCIRGYRHFRIPALLYHKQKGTIRTLRNLYRAFSFRFDMRFFTNTPHTY